MHERPAAAAPASAVGRDLLKLVSNPVVRPRRTICAQHPNLVQVRRPGPLLEAHLNAHAVGKAILTLSQSLLNNTAWVGLGVLADTMRRRLAERPGQWADSEAALVDQDVRAAALETVAKLRALPVDRLAVRSTETSGKGAMTVEVEDPDGAVFRVEVIDRRGVFMAKVRKTTESNPD